MDENKINITAKDGIIFCGENSILNRVDVHRNEEEVRNIYVIVEKGVSYMAVEGNVHGLSD